MDNPLFEFISSTAARFFPRIDSGKAFLLFRSRYDGSPFLATTPPLLCFSPLLRVLLSRPVAASFLYRFASTYGLFLFPDYNRSCIGGGGKKEEKSIVDFSMMILSPFISANGFERNEDKICEGDICFPLELASVRNTPIFYRMSGVQISYYINQIQRIK